MKYFCCLVKPCGLGMTQNKTNQSVINGILLGLAVNLSSLVVMIWKASGSYMKYLNTSFTTALNKPFFFLSPDLMLSSEASKTIVFLTISLYLFFRNSQNRNQLWGASHPEGLLAQVYERIRAHLLRGFLQGKVRPTLACVCEWLHNIGFSCDDIQIKFEN